MSNPVIALIWESWRLSRRWYLWVLPMAFAFDYLIMRQASGNAVRRVFGPDAVPEIVAVLIAPGAFIINFSLAIFATLLAVSLGNKSGFPLSFEFRLPVKTSLLVAVPMLTLATLCASLYVLPMLAVRLVYGVPIPLVPAAALIATLVLILLACGWSVTSSGARTFAMFVGIVVGSQLGALLDPVDMSNPRFAPGEVPVFNQNIIALTPGEYAFLAGFGLLLFALTSASIGKQRYSEAPVLQLPGVTAAQPRRSAASWRAFPTRVAGLLSPPCPTRSPWQAELWLEARRQVLPILLLSVVITACVPLFYLLGMAPQGLLDDSDYVFPGAVFFIGIGITIFNRRQASGGYMSAFEGTRGMSTLALATVQVLAVAGATFCGIALVLAGVHFVSGLVEVPGKLGLRIRDLLAFAQEASLVTLFTTATAGLVNYVAWVMLLACIHTWSVVWGRWVPYGAGVLTIYAAAQMMRIQTGTATLDDIRQHLWVVAITIFAATVLAFARTLYTGVLSLRVSAAALLAWVTFVACSVYSKVQQGLVFTQLAAEMQAFQGAVLVAPLLCFVLLLWSYDRLRHR